jgi:selenide,water dikinase
LLGHAREMALGSKLRAYINLSSVPFLAQSEVLAASGFITGASGRNWSGYGHDVTLTESMSDIQKALLCDPQTSGGLLVACTADSVDQVLSLFHAQGFARAAVIGELVAGQPGIDVKP